MANFEDLLLQTTEVSDQQDLDNLDKVMSNLYSNSDFVDLLLSFRQTNELNLRLFKVVIIEQFKQIDVFLDPKVIIQAMIIELSDNGDLTEYVTEIRGIIEYSVKLIKL